MKTTKQDFELFKSECERWIEFFGFKDYEISFRHRDLGDENDAQTTGDQEEDFAHQMINIILSTDLTDFPTKEERKYYLKRTAFHEVCEILLMEIYIPLGKFYSEKYCQKLGHQLIRRLENSVFKKFQNEKN